MMQQDISKTVYIMRKTHFRDILKFKTAKTDLADKLWAAVSTRIDCLIK